MSSPIAAATCDYALAVDVNRRVNEGVRYVTDEEQFGLPDVWREAKVGGAGDCEDFALSKRRGLLDAGTPSAALRLAICRTELHQMHMVLIVTTPGGDYVLDNRHPLPMRRQDLGYAWLAMKEGSQWLPIAS